MNDANDAPDEYRTTTIGNAIGRLLYDIDVVRGSADPIKGHPGDGADILDHGIGRIASHPIILADPSKAEPLKVAVRAVYDKAQKLCESPIERNLLAALITGCWPFSQSVVPLVHNAKDHNEPFPKSDVVIVPQLALFRYRLDFGIVVEKAGAKRIVCIECDGKEFHQDREREYARDAYLYDALGIPVLHYSGTTLYRRPLATADAIIDAIGDWMGK